VYDELNTLRSSVDSLTRDADVRPDAERLLSEVKALVERVNGLKDKLDRDYASLTNVKNGVMLGANNPIIRAKMEYGKEKHVYNQRICEEKEMVLNSGKPDCVSFQENNCRVWEFKPDTYSESDARAQAERYIPDVVSKFRDNERVKKNCLKDSAGAPIFTAVGVLYPACRE
jgi:hypothetical protein